MNDRRITEEAAGWYLDMRENPGAYAQEQFLAWLRRSPQHVAEYLAIAQLHGDMRAVAAMDGMSLDELRALAATEPSVVPLRRDQAAGPREVPARQPRRHQPARWAAAARGRGALRPGPLDGLLGGGVVALAHADGGERPYLRAVLAPGIALARGNRNRSREHQRARRA